MLSALLLSSLGLFSAVGLFSPVFVIEAMHAHISDLVRPLCAKLLYFCLT